MIGAKTHARHNSLRHGLKQHCHGPGQHAGLLGKDTRVLYVLKWDKITISKRSIKEILGWQ